MLTLTLSNSQVKRISRAEEKFAAYFKNSEHRFAKTKEEQDEIQKLIIAILTEVNNFFILYRVVQKKVYELI